MLEEVIFRTKTNPWKIHVLEIKCYLKTFSVQYVSPLEVDSVSKFVCVFTFMLSKWIFKVQTAAAWKASLCGPWGERSQGLDEYSGGGWEGMRVVWVDKVRGSVKVNSHFSSLS